MKRLKLVLLSSVMGLSTNVFAHGVMHETVPANGSSMSGPTDRVELTFKNPTKLISIKLLDSEENSVPVDFERSTEAGTHFESMFQALQPGSYTVQWKAMGEDGHMMKGDFGFKQE